MKKENMCQRSCNNCRYYSQHYSKQGTKFRTVNCGHCLYKSVRNYKSRPLVLCEHWEDIAVKKEERKESIIETLRYMAEHINEIAVILKDDKSENNQP